MCFDKHGEDLVILNIEEAQGGITDFFVLATGQSGRQLQAMADFVRHELKAIGLLPLGVEGYDDGSWILLDYGDAVLHLFLPDTRTYYNLEFLWSRAPRVPWEPLEPEASEEEEGKQEAASEEVVPEQESASEEAVAEEEAASEEVVEG